MREPSLWSAAPAHVDRLDRLGVAVRIAGNSCRRSGSSPSRCGGTASARADARRPARRRRAGCRSTSRFSAMRRCSAIRPALVRRPGEACSPRADRRSRPRARAPRRGWSGRSSPRRASPRRGGRACGRLRRRAAHRGLSRIATERAWASRPSASAERDRGGPERGKRSGPHLRIEVRFMKSSTPRPDEKRAERAVGSTWFEPADIVADRLRRVTAEEDRAGVADAAGERLGVGDRRSRGARARSRRRAAAPRRARAPG